MTWQERHIEDAERMIAYARSTMPPGTIGSVPIKASFELDEIPLEMLGEHPVIHYDDRHRMYEEDFNALVQIEINSGRVDQETADRATANFHDYIRATHLFPPQYSPRFFQ